MQFKLLVVLLGFMGFAVNAMECPGRPHKEKNARVVAERMTLYRFIEAIQDNDLEALKQVFRDALQGDAQITHENLYDAQEKAKHINPSMVPLLTPGTPQNEAMLQAIQQEANGQ